MHLDQKYTLPDGHNKQQFIDKLAKLYTIEKEPPVAERLTICDTFDWRLFNKSLVLVACENRLFLRKLAKSEIMHSAEISSFPVFIWEFPDGKLKDRLAAIIKMRALIRLVEVSCTSTPYRILNADEKTVLRLAYEEFQTSRKKNAPILATHLWLKPVKGYPKYARNLARRIEAAGFALSKADDIYFDALAVVDKKPGSYSAKVNIPLDPDMRSDKATKTILGFLLQVMRINEANLEKDLDTEFLHDFRVAIRRTRSALGQIKFVFPTKTTNRFKKDFAFVGKLSNELRDLDVYLLNEDKYKAMLPPILRDDIDPLFDYLRKKRSNALEKVNRSLKTKKYAKVMNDWEAFLDKGPQNSVSASNAEVSVIDLARNRIDKKYRNVVKVGSQILENTEDKMLHVLRIHCKKLRYLMEFFSSLFPRKKMNTLIAQLKKLQDNLGDFNDLCVQREYLLNLIEELPTTQQQNKKTLAAIGSLIGAMDKEKQTVKAAFAKTFTDFASSANQELFGELFNSKALPESA
jgi:CHAD domain-containing protein